MAFQVSNMVSTKRTSHSPPSHDQQAQRFQMREHGVELLLLPACETREVGDGALPINQHQRHALATIQRELIELIAEHGPPRNDQEHLRRQRWE